MKGVRFAPSPTGRFHLGNLRTAWISYAWAQALGEPWIVRFEDIDTPRVLVGAQDLQIADMAALGLKPDEITVQSQRYTRHQELFEYAKKVGAIYCCNCSRKEVLQALQNAASAPHSPDAIYNGECRKHPANDGAAWRFRNTDESGAQDFIIARIENGVFVPAYHWACAIDDWDGEYRLLVRAWDLESAATQQRAIQHWLNSVEGEHPFAAIFHTSLVTGSHGERLEKRTKGVTLPEVNHEKVLEVFAKFNPPLAELTPGKIWGEAKHRTSVTDLGF